MHTNCPHCRRHVTVKPIRNSLINFKGTCTYCKNKVRMSNLEQHINYGQVFDYRKEGRVYG